MKRRPLTLLTLFLLTLVLLHPSSASAQDQPKITTDQPFEAWVIFAEETAGCGGSLSLTSPFEQHILDYESGVDVVFEIIGPFDANTELTFSLTPHLPCSTETLFSENPNHAYIEKSPQGNSWGLIWLLNDQTDVSLTIVALQELSSTTHHPVIFIHGHGGRPEDWTTGDKRVYIDALKAEPYNYPENYLMTYAYADADGDPDTYDYQGDITKISGDLGAYVSELSARHLADGGDGKVDIVGFSLGGLVARQYLNENPEDHKIRKLITIASPHRGAYIFMPERWFDLIPFAGNYLKKAFNVFMENTLLAFVDYLDASGQPKDLDSPAIQQITPGSGFLSTLNSLFWNTPEPEYDTLYGDIDAEFRHKIFFFEFKKRISIGDGYILPGSATGVPAEVVGEYSYSDPVVLNVRAAEAISGGYEYVLDTLSISDLSAWHGKLVTRSDVVGKVVELLTVED